MGRLVFALFSLIFVISCSLQHVISGGNGFQSAIINQQVYVWGRQGRIGDGTFEFNRTIGIPIDHNGVWAQTTVSALSCGVEHMVALEASGKMYSWGDNTFGQIGDNTMGSLFSKYTPTQVSQTSGVMAGKEVTQVVAGGFHSIALTTNNQLFAWGYGLNGNLGDNGSQHKSYPVLVNTGALSGKQITQITAGNYHSLLLTNDGTIYSWGDGTSGQLGNGATDPVGAPSSVLMTGAMTGKEAVKISAGSYFSLALTNDGILFAWGDNRYGQLGIGNTLNNNSPVQVTMNGALSGRLIVQIATGYYHCVVLTDNNKLFTWGYNGNGELGDGTFNNALSPSAMNMNVFQGRSISQISAGLNSLVITNDDALFTWGNNDYCQIGDGTNITRPVPTMVGFVPFTRISGGNSFSLALSTAKNTYRQVLSWGNNNYGQLGDGTTVQRKVATFGALVGQKVMHLASGSTSYSTFAITSQGTLYGWGYNGWGQLGDGTFFQRTSPVPVVTSSLQSGDVWMQVSPAYYHTLAITGKGKVYSWGYNGYGQLGIGSQTSQYSPILVNSISNMRIIQAEAGYYHSLALTTDGKVYSWGGNDYGQLGINSTQSALVPTPIFLPSELIGIPTIKITASYYHCVMLTLDGRVYSWGRNFFGQLGIGNTTNFPIPVPVNPTAFQGKRLIKLMGSNYCSLALSNDGQIYGWGSGSNLFLGKYSSLSPQFIGNFSGTLDIDLGNDHCLLATNSSVIAWGGNYYGQLGDNTTVTRYSFTRSLCSAGYDPSWFCDICPKGRFSLDGSNNCSDCEAGTYNDHIGSSNCTSCTNGTSSGSIGATSASTCQYCNPGMYAPTSSSNCINCPSGTYNGQVGSRSCISCPSGTASSSVGAISVTTCLSCNPGSYGPTTGASSCTSCPSGTYNSQVGATSCTLCPKGSTSTTSSSACQLCNPGSYATTDGATSCTKCPYGTYSQVAGSSSFSDCLKCKAGTYSDVLGSTSCTNCPNGTMSSEGAKNCETLNPPGPLSKAMRIDQNYHVLAMILCFWFAIVALFKQ